MKTWNVSVVRHIRPQTKNYEVEAEDEEEARMLAEDLARDDSTWGEDDDETFRAEDCDPSGEDAGEKPPEKWEASYPALLGKVEATFETEDEARDWLRRVGHTNDGTVRRTDIGTAESDNEN